jgi:hypothetical protein
MQKRIERDILSFQSGTGIYAYEGISSTFYP